MTELHIRPALIHERPYLVELQRRASLANPGDRELLLERPELIDTPLAFFTAGNVLVAERDDVVLGFAALVLRDDGDAELDGLFVEPQHWRHGIGHALVEAIVARAVAAGARTLYVIGNTHAEGFYARAGFRLDGIIQTEFGRNLLMDRTLGGE